MGRMEKPLKKTSEGQILKGLSKRGQTIIVVTHDMDVAQQTDRIITMRDGMIASDTASDDKK